MFKASWWKQRGYSEEYAKQIAECVRALAREINLREEDIEGTPLTSKDILGEVIKLLKVQVLS
jgi:hypothetical protein